MKEKLTSQLHRDLTVYSDLLNRQAWQIGIYASQVITSSLKEQELFYEELPFRGPEFIVNMCRGLAFLTEAIEYCEDFRRGSISDEKHEKFVEIYHANFIYREGYLERKTCQGKHTDCFHLKGIFDDCRKPRSLNEDPMVEERLLYCESCRKHESGRDAFVRAPKMDPEVFALIPPFVYDGIQKYREEERIKFLKLLEPIDK